MLGGDGSGPAGTGPWPYRAEGRPLAAVSPSAAAVGRAQPDQAVCWGPESGGLGGRVVAEEELGWEAGLGPVQAGAQAEEGRPRSAGVWLAGKEKGSAADSWNEVLSCPSPMLSASDS